MAARKRSPRIVRLEAKNIQGLRAALVEHVPGKGLVPVTGKNGSGKSSLLKAIRGALGGAAQVHERVLHDGAEDGTGYVQITMSDDFEVTRRHTAANPKGTLVVKGPDGGRHGQSKLNELLGGVDPDIMGFFGLPVAEKRRILLSLGTDPDLVEKLERKRRDWQKLYETRTPEISAQRKARGVTQPAGERPKPIDTSAEIARLQELQAQDRELGDAARSVQNGERSLTAAAGGLRTAQNLVARLEQELAAAQRDVAVTEIAYKDAGVALEAVKAARAALPDPTEEIAQVTERIGRADAVIASLEPWKTYDRARAEDARATAEVDRITLELDAVEGERTALVAAAAIPVPDISFSPEGEPLFKGRPLELASGAEQVRIAFAVARAAGAGLCLIDEGDVLDDSTLAEIQAAAEEGDGVQVWLCSLGRDGPGLVQVVDGEARTAVEAPAEASVA